MYSVYEVHGRNIVCLCLGLCMVEWIALGLRITDYTEVASVRVCMSLAGCVGVRSMSVSSISLIIDFDIGTEYGVPMLDIYLHLRNTSTKPNQITSN